MITGLSGSGKSSLAFDTIYAEGQRRYVESLSAYARQFLEMMQKPDVDQIDGLSPAISIEQKTTSRNPRSTVGTVTEIYDYMRLLWARIGVPYSPATGLPIESQTVSQMVDRVMALPEGTRLFLLAPIVRGRKGEYRKEFAELQKKGFQRVKVDGAFHEIADVPDLNKKIKHDIDVVVDRIVVRPDLGNRLADSFEIALGLADGIAVVEMADAPKDKKKDEAAERIIFSSRFACPVSGFTIDEIEPRLFSFNNPFGACPACDGLGTQFYMDPDLVVPDHGLSLKKGAIAPWSRSTSPYYTQTLMALAKQYKFSMTAPWSQLPEEAQNVILYGSGDEVVTFAYARRHALHTTDQKTVRRRDPELGAALARNRQRLGARGDRALQSAVTDCHGLRRLPPEAGGARLSRSMAAYRQVVANVASARPIAGAARCSEHLTRPSRTRSPQRVLKEIRERLRFLQQCRPRIPDAVAQRRHTVRAAKASASASLRQIGSGPDRRAVRAGRAVHRPAPARQRPPA